VLLYLLSADAAKADRAEALIVSAALRAGCRTLHAEDMQHGQFIDHRLTIRNPIAD
jgi:predicted nucleic acid-binding protein